MIQAETTCYDHAERWSNCTRRTAEVRFHLDCTRVVRLRGRHGGSDAQPPDGPSAETRRAAHGCGGRPAWWGHGGGSRGSRWRRCGVRLVPAPPQRLPTKAAARITHGARAPRHQSRAAGAWSQRCDALRRRHAGPSCGQSHCRARNRGASALFYVLPLGGELPVDSARWTGAATVAEPGH